MPLKTKVKVSEITNLSDARYFASYGVHWLTFTCNPIAKTYQKPAAIVEQMKWLSGPLCCLQVAGLSENSITNLFNEINCDGIELESEQRISTEIVNEKTVFRRLIIGPQTTKEDVENRVNYDADYYILDFRLNTLPFSALIQHKIELSIDDIGSLANSYPLLLSIDVAVEELELLLETPLKGIELRGGQEEKVGLRSFEDVQDIMEELEHWD